VTASARTSGRARARSTGRLPGSRATAGLAALLALAVAFGVSRIDFDGTLRELTLPLEYENIIRQQAGEKQVDAELIAAVIYSESRFRDQTSDAGARGLMQITPATADTIETLSGGETFEYEDLADPDLNIRYGTFFLRHLLDRYEGNETAALAGYNAGIGNADAWGGAAMETSDIAFAETRVYVEQVLDKRKEYAARYERELGLRG
jgi:soluble lytic murein transglycosylase